MRPMPKRGPHNSDGVVTCYWVEERRCSDTSTEYILDVLLHAKVDGECKAWRSKLTWRQPTHQKPNTTHHTLTRRVSTWCLIKKLPSFWMYRKGRDIDCAGAARTEVKPCIAPWSIHCVCYATHRPSLLGHPYKIIWQNHSLHCDMVD